MFKKRIWKPLLIGLGWTISLAGLVVLMSFISIKKSEVVCTAIKVYIPGSHYFIDRQEVDNILQMNSHTLIGRRIENIDLYALEQRLKNNPFVESANVYADMDGVIQVEVSQRQPILRVMNRFGQDFYVDQHGLKMPLSQNFTARVIVANGFIDELFANRVDSLHNTLAIDLYTTADYIHNDSLWDAQISQIYVNHAHEIELIPRVGTQRILLGNADSLDLRFSNLKAFYKKALPLVGWDAYKVINIKYSNQVIGVKNQSLVDSLAAEKAKAKKAAADSALAAGTTRVRRDSTAAPGLSDDAERPVDERPVVIKPTVVKPRVTKPQVAKPAVAKPVTAKPTTRVVVKPASHKPTPEDVIVGYVVNKKVAHTTVAHKPSDKTLKAGKPPAKQATKQKPVGKQQAEKKKK
ncbi:cell division protein FtsQ [Mucilaginibacter psychrotolerans]|uniref:Cell division protein FtsQ n=1 Tax=Mucilaginibacter psychrotolerans TaxID=1524096 RepID=A0A4Y8SQ25_9SPHI|nr:cell division protein FtsQ [Mucilaginibacter psychrotolerans]TFF40912.1 cell division protein FtsQ [Mucilaginibacter psychrotolerans]